MPEENLKALSVSFAPQNTSVNTKWGVKHFTEWMMWQRETNQEDAVPENLLVSDSSAELNEWLSYFILESRRKDGKHFPSSTITLLL